MRNLTEECAIFSYFLRTECIVRRSIRPNVLSLTLLIRYRSRFVLRPSTQWCSANLSSLRGFVLYIL